MAKKNSDATHAVKRCKTSFLRWPKKAPHRKILWLSGNLQNVGKIMVCCNLSAVRGTLSPQRIEQTTFAFRLNPLKTLEILAFLAAPACRATETPAEALVSRAKSYGSLKTCKTIGKTCFPDVASPSLPKGNETGTGRDLSRSGGKR